jgi:C1A family cysteine protease
MFQPNNRTKRGWHLDIHAETRSVSSTPLPTPVEKTTESRTYSLTVNHLPKEHLKIKHFAEKALLQKTALPTIVDMRSKMPPVYDQGNLGSCTANALCAAYQYLKPTFSPSRLFLYYNERVIENDILIDGGAFLINGVKSLVQTGVCPENLWPYIESQFSVKPTPNCYTDAAIHKALTDHNVLQTLTQMKACLQSGLPFAVGITVYETFELQAVANTGLVPMPDLTNEENLGGHAVLVCGYNDSIQWWQNKITYGKRGQRILTQTTNPTMKGAWIVRNSWGSKWGAAGYFYLPYPYLTNLDLAGDLWALDTVK